MFCMKIAIITWCSYQNFGTYLQAYAMQWQLREMGHEAILLDDSIYTTGFTSTLPIRVRLFLRCKRCVKLMIPWYRRNLRNDQISLGLYQDFRNRWLDIDKGTEPLELLDRRYDCYVCGSDQIWSAECLSSVGKEFFSASFARKPKIAYAPSGLVNYPLSARSELSDLVSGFTYLSAREANAASMLHDLTGKDVATVVDPTLLIPKEIWEELAQSKKDFEGSYILLYLLKRNDVYVRAAKQYARNKGYVLKIIHSVYVNHGEHTIPAGPSEFLLLLKNAKMVMTDSFHGTIFAIKFRRPFITFQRFHDNEDNSQNSRIENLLDMADLSDRLINKKSIGKIWTLEKLNFDEVDKRMLPFIESSKKYLDKAISGICYGR